MFRNYLLIALRIIDRQRMYSALNIAGLAIGMAAFLLIALYTQYELSFDRYHDNAERIYRIVRDGRTLTPPPLGPALQNNFDEVEAVARLIQDENTLVSRGDKHFLEKNFYWAGPGIFEIFSFEFVHGQAEIALAEPSSIVISESVARKYFGEANPIGETLKIDDSRDFRVTGVFADMPANSHFIMDAMVPYLDYFRGTDLDMTSWNSNYTYTYFLLRKDADPRALERSIHEVIEIPLLEKFNVPKPWPDNFYFAQPITDIHLKSHREQEISVNNDIGYVLLFASIAVLVLFIACINYVNLSTARSARRGREVGMRKVVGASRMQLVQQFMGESFFLVLLALALTLVIVNLALPAFADLVERPLSMAAMLEPRFLLVLVATLVLVGLLAGGYPAVSISGFKPVKMLKGSLVRSGGGKALRNVLVLFQFSVTIALFICTLTVNRQLEFVNGYDVGYSKDNIINLRIRDRSIRANIDTVKTELMQHPGVLSVAASHRLPNDIDGFTSQALDPRFPQQETAIYYNTADYDFIDLYGIQIVQGRNFSRDQVSDAQGVFLVNEAAVRTGNWDNPLEQTMEHWSGETGPVVGVMKDFHLHSLHNAIEPLYIFLDPQKFTWLSVKVESTDLSATLAHLEKVMKAFSPNFPFEYTFFDQEFARAYQAEQKMGSVFSSFAILAIIVACLGLFGLSAFTAQQRTREIGIRKVMGASVARITVLLSSEFMRWVVIANLLAWPVAWLVMDRWLQNFALRTSQDPVFFVLSAAGALVIALLTVSVLSVRAASASPIKALSYE